MWLDLFAHSKVANEYATGTLPPQHARDDIAAKLGDEKDRNREEAINEPEEGTRPTNPSVNQESRDSGHHAEATNLVDGSLNRNRHHDHFAASNPISITPDQKDIMTTVSLSPLEHLSIADRDRKLTGEVNCQGEDIAKPPTEGSTLPSHEERSNGTSQADQSTELLLEAVKTERADEFGAFRTPQSAAITLQAAKDQLMARLADTATGMANDGEQDLMTFPHDGNPNGRGPPLSDEDDEYKSPGEPGDQERGLLTDIPLVLGPQEIEALPMIIQIGICAGQGVVRHGRDMQGMRCNILLAGEPGRNLLRELLIFIAAWDLQDDEMYFKLMMQIMEAILENGLMPYAYQTFAEVKDIVSPAQSMVIKILTQIFRGKQGLPPTTGKAAWTAGNVHADTSRRVDVYIVRYIFTIFRQCIIPETCALIYLQGQIKAGHALPEDFPLNLWDMERVYEGVYQFLEFFAVLTESEEWKDLLVNWEIVSELVTLLRELEASIPHAPLAPVPQTTAEAQAQRAAMQKSIVQQAPSPSQSAPVHVNAIPVAVERPFDVADIPMPADGPMPGPSPVSHSDSQDQDALDVADPSDFEWRNLKKLVILVLSSLVWKSRTVQDQIRRYGGVEMVVACCTYDGNNPYIKEHAIMGLRFLVEGNDENRELMRRLEQEGNPVFRGIRASGVVRPEDIGGSGHSDHFADGSSRVEHADGEL